MTMTRHLLVVATRCGAVGQPDALERAASTLHAALTDPALKAMSGPPVVSFADPADARLRVMTAARTAGRAGATLVLAVLGAARGNHYVTADGAMVDLRQLLQDCAEIVPLTALLDLHGAAHPVTVDGGTVLTAATDDLRATFALSAVITAGDPAGDEHITLDPALAATIGATLTGDPVPLVPNRVWVPHLLGEVIGPLGRATVDRLLHAWGEFPVPPVWTRERFDELRAAVESAQDTLGTRRILHTHSALFYAVRAAECARELDLSTDAIRAAATAVGLTGDGSGSGLLVRVLEDAALNGSARGKPKAAVARLLVALAKAVGAGGEHPALRTWAADAHAEPELRDAASEVHVPLAGRKELRLVVSLAAEAPLWPDAVEAYLLRPGQSPTPQTVFESDRTQAGAEAAIGQALAWADGRLRPGERLRHLDLAAPAHLLATWYPERSRPGRFFLGARHQVLTQWTGWLDPTTYRADLHDNAHDVLHRVGATAGVPLDPLGADALGDLDVLDERLANSEFTGAIAIDHRPADLAAVLDLLLPYCPILLWPREEGEGWLTALYERWGSLPEGLASAYRDGSPLRCLRSVWHDEDWLVFGRRLARREMNPPTAS
ncbi:hypothetical protein CLV68_2264 [Actinokineospora cianjurensis]|uniref:vWA-MoxR associated protein middle region 2 domain-containing protein n=2 Tax=Actinokineospora cianjurensis TaxID=585224 RepID=A0A421BBJ8_9PSEU|nr:hypothetical protein CLV68_2264 [Actinokineospora cianjurensis]